MTQHEGTSVPVPTAADACDLPIDPDATAYVVVATAPGADTAARAFAARLEGVPVTVLAADSGETALAATLARARVGWRFAVLGAEPGRARAHAAIRAAGALECEIVTAGPGEAEAGARQVYCAHCHAVSQTAAALGETTRCGGCGSPLTVYHHFSPRIPAYLGYHPGAEDLP
ncbi:dimethylamine monooxygenase subunit DmmA family protein [Nocardia sp. CA-290969]|uniref:dimethylamine monooxygenase subunit DmmA family protein n=1 Tax=Nocardia sp. CA-290969 TaxID=3239986 RepID=UPI003D8A551A